MPSIPKKYEFQDCECAMYNGKSRLKIPAGVWPVIVDQYYCEVLVRHRPYELIKKEFTKLLETKKAVPV